MNRAAGRRHGDNLGAFDLATLSQWSQRFAPLIAEQDRLMRSYVRGKRATASFRPLPAKPPAGFASPEAYVASLNVELIYSRLGEDGLRVYYERLAADVRSLKASAARRVGDTRHDNRRQRIDEW
ncbi:MAG: hypothetical protein IIA44_15140, partial [Acidobacteria bacterium]|nr:hypothetical protein [Acidobacteriota bacterium]